MKIEQLIVQQLYNSKKVTIQDIGTFTLSPDIALPSENDKDAVMPENAVSFIFDKKAKQDDDLITFIVSQTRKIKPLATSDLESYSILAKQFLNIGKPFPIEGLGVLQKTQAGDYEFIQGQSINAKLEAAPALLKEKTEEEISFSTPPREQPGTNKWILLIALVLIAATGATLYYFLKKNNKEEKLAEQVVPKTDTIVRTDSILKSKDTVSQIKPVIPDSTSAIAKKDGYTFKVVIKEYMNRDVAQKAYDKYTTYGHKLLLYTRDSVTYKIAMPFNSPLSDTSHAKDSLRIFFNARTYVEKN